MTGRAPAATRSAGRAPAAMARDTAASSASASVSRDERVPQQHRRAQDGRVGIGDAASGDVGRRAVDGLVQAAAPACAERGGGQQAQRAGQHRGLVGEDVAEHVLGDDDVEVARAAGCRCMAAESTSMCSKLHVGEFLAQQRARPPSATGARSRARSPCRPRSACAAARARELRRRARTTRSISVTV